MTIQEFKDKLKDKKIIISSGGMGTEISARGIKTTLPLWSSEALLHAHEVVREIHIDYINAEAEIIVTNTFRTQRRTFDKKGIGDEAKNATILACRLAQEALEETGKRDVLIAGSVAPLEDCYSPELTPPNEELEKEHLEHAQNLKEGIVDFLIIETMPTIRETEFAVKAAQKVGLPFAVSFCANGRGELLSGEKIGDAIKVLEKYEPLFIGLNCMNINLINEDFKALKKVTSLPLYLSAQGDGLPDDDQGWTFTGKKESDLYAHFAKKWVEDGALIIGGCCGTNPNYIKKLVSVLKDKKISKDMSTMMQTFPREVSS